MELCRSSPADPPGENVIQSNWQQPDVIGNKEKRVNQMAVRHINDVKDNDGFLCPHCGKLINEAA